MLLLCSGEDSYRALEKARELEAAFIQKHDPSGSAVERLPSGKDGVEALLVAATGGSLFSSRRFFRVDGVISSCPKNRVEALVKTLERDTDNTIVACKEEGVVSDKLLKPFRGLPKFHHYTFDALSPAPFLKWATAFAKKVEVSDTAAIRALADVAQGDTWAFVNEFHKWRAGGVIAGSVSSSPTVYDVIDRLLARRADRWSAVRAFDDPDAIVASMLTQVRSLVLVRSGHTTGVHPYVAQKLSRLQTPDPASVYSRLATAFTWSRTGRANAEEALDVLG